MFRTYSWTRIGAIALLCGWSTFGCGGGGSGDDNSARTAGAAGVAGTGSGGAAGVGGAAGQGGGAAGSAAGSSGSAGTDGGPAVDMCGFPDPLPTDGIVYDGVTMAPACSTSIKAPRAGYWFTYHDSPRDGGVAGSVTNGGAKPGCAGANDCAFHLSSTGSFEVYGAGAGFDLNDDASMTAQPYDLAAKAYKGIQFWAKGTIVGTRGPNYSKSDRTIHLKIPTTTFRGGDDYGFYCVLDADPVKWTQCRLDFSTMARDGFCGPTQVPTPCPDKASDSFDLNQALKIQFEFSLYTPSGDAEALTPVSFDVWIDEVSFF